jgi:hypothetical protein
MAVRLSGLPCGGVGQLSSRASSRQQCVVSASISDKGIIALLYLVGYKGMAMAVQWLVALKKRSDPFQTDDVSNEMDNVFHDREGVCPMDAMRKLAEV